MHYRIFDTAPSSVYLHGRKTSPNEVVHMCEYNAIIQLCLLLLIFCHNPQFFIIRRQQQLTILIALPTVHLSTLVLFPLYIFSEPSFSIAYSTRSLRNQNQAACEDTK